MWTWRGSHSMAVAVAVATFTCIIFIPNTLHWITDITPWIGLHQSHLYSNSRKRGIENGKNAAAHFTLDDIPTLRYTFWSFSCVRRSVKRKHNKIIDIQHCTRWLSFKLKVVIEYFIAPDSADPWSINRIRTDRPKRVQFIVWHHAINDFWISNWNWIPHSSITLL